MLGALFIVALASLAVYIWKYFKEANKHWEKKGVVSKKPLPFFGNSWDQVSRSNTLHNSHKEIYDMFPNEPYYGYYSFTHPFLVIRDIELIERVLIKDFHHFTDHLPTVGDFNPLDTNLFNMNGNKWRAMRNKLSPMFTTGKLKHMLPQIEELCEVLVSALEKENCKDVNLTDFLERFAMDVIASCAFGLSLNAITENEESEYRRMGQLAFKGSLMQFVRFITIMVAPKVARYLKVAQNNPTATKYFAKIVRETLEHRRTSDFTRNDFVQLMLTLQQKGFIEFEGDENDDYLKTEPEDKKMEHFELTDDTVAGQSFIFLVAGFETSAVGMSYLLYELAQHPEVQTKVREEIIRVIKSRNGVINYDAIKEMTYLNQCIKETLRIHTFVPILFRMCTKDYTFQETGLTIKAGDLLYIPVYGIHMDPTYYPEPEKFKPERFAPDVNRLNCTYLAFGDGPRTCIAMRFALMEIKLCATRILKDYNVELSSKTILPLESNPVDFGNKPKNPLYFNLTKLNTL